jgi:hypothetical protein
MKLCTVALPRLTRLRHQRQQWLAIVRGRLPLLAVTGLSGTGDDARAGRGVNRVLTAIGTSKHQQVPAAPCIDQEFHTPQAARMPRAMALKSPIKSTGLPKLIAFFGIASHGGLEGDRTMVMPPAL